MSDHKVAIQLAADAEWPHSNTENAGVRGQFTLAARRPLVA